MDEVISTLRIEIGASADEALREFEKLKNALANFKTATKNAGNGSGNGAAGKTPLSQDLRDIIENANKVDVLIAKLRFLREEMEKAFNAGDEKKAYGLRGQILNTEDALARARKTIIPLSNEMRDMISNADKITILTAKIALLKQELQEAFEAGDQKKAIGIQEKILQAQNALDKATASANRAGDAAERAGIKFNLAALKFGKFGSLLRSIGRIAYYRMVRAAIRAVVDAFKTGAENAYWYSKKFGQGTKYISEAYDQLASASYKMKNQLGASWATLKAAVTPVLMEIVRYATLAANALTQFFAVLGGHTTYLRAIDYTKEWAEATSAGAAAAKEWRNQLLGFDEINRLNEPSSGGGGSGSAIPDYENMFEEAELSDFFKKVKENLETIKDFAIAIGLAFAAWKIIGFLNNLLGIGASMKEILGIALAVAGAFLLVSGALDAITNGVNWANFTKMLSGTLLLAGGLYLAFGATAGAIGLLIGGFVMLGVAIYDWIQKGELTTESFWTLEAGILAVGVGLSLLTGSWIPLAIAAIAALCVAIYQYRDKIKEAFDNIYGYLGNGKIDWQDFAIGVASVLASPIQAVQTLINWIKNLIQYLGNAHDWIQNVLDGLALLPNGFKNAYNNNKNSGSVWDDPSYWGGGFASGGFPDEGQLFFARESGPELVGSIGGHTAVANNDQIIDGIRAGVYDAVSAAMNGKNGDQVIKVYLDSREIRAGQQRLARAMGG